MRLRVNLLNRILEKGLTAKEFDFLMFLLRYQDDEGKVVGVYHSMVCKEKGMCKQSFYSCLAELKNKNIINYQRANGDYDVFLLGNEIVKKDSKGKGVQYINLDAAFFKTDSFKDLSCNAKLIAIDLYRQLIAGKGRKKYARSTFIDTYTKKLSVHKKTVLRYLTELHSVFRFKLKLRNYIISFLDMEYEDAMEVSNRESAGFITREYIAKTLLRRSKVTYGKEQVRDLTTLYTQYRETVKDTFGLLNKALQQSLSYLMRGECISISLVHSIFRSLANLSSGDSGNSSNKNYPISAANDYAKANMDNLTYIYSL